VCSPRPMAGHARVWAGVGAENASENQVRTGA
jgi:hypothetical protein